MFEQDYVFEFDFPVIELFEKFYEKTDNKKNFIRVIDVINCLKTTENYNNLLVKKRFNGNVTSVIKTNEYFRYYYKIHSNKGQLLLGFKQKTE
jgi:hypothetical protein